MAVPERWIENDVHKGCRSTVSELLGEVERLRKGLTKIERLQSKWDAPVQSDDVAASNRAWAAVGSEAVKIARDELNA